MANHLPQTNDGTNRAAAAAAAAAAATTDNAQRGRVSNHGGGVSAKEAKKQERAGKSRSRSRRMTNTERFISSAVRTIGRQVGSALVRGLLGSLIRRR